jgi:hypothetical protein
MNRWITASVVNDLMFYRVCQMIAPAIFDLYGVFNPDRSIARVNDSRKSINREK